MERKKGDREEERKEKTKILIFGWGTLTFSLIDGRSGFWLDILFNTVVFLEVFVLSVEERGC